MMKSRCPLIAVSLVTFVICSLWCQSSAPADERPEFKNPIDNSPIKLEPLPGEVETPAVKKFKETGVNDYRNDPQAIEEGKRLYTQQCAVCHGADGKGKMGPALFGDDLVYPQVKTDPGMFSVIYAGASGAMQSFHRRGLTQDQILKIVAYVRSLEK